MAQLKDLIVLGTARILNKIYASEFIGKLTGNADTATSATKATQDESGNNIKASYASSIDISDHTITLKNKNEESLGTVTVPDNNTWRPLGTTADTACAGNDSRLSNARPASDVYSWAKASSKPSYSWDEIANKPSTFTPASHTHNYLPLSGGTLTDELVIDTGNEAKGIYFVNPSDKSKGTRVSYVDGSPFVQGAWDAVVLKENGTLLSNKYAEYEEGTFSLILGINAEAYSVSGQHDIDQKTIPGRYKRIGNMCYIAADSIVENNTKGYLRIVGGLPFAIRDKGNSVGFVGINCAPKGTIYPVNYLDMDYFGGAVQFDYVEVSDNFYFKVSLWYETI